MNNQDLLKKAEETVLKEFKTNIDVNYAISKDVALAAGGLLGILVSLTDLTDDCYPARLLFLLSLCLLSLSILTLVVSMLWILKISRHQLKRSLWHLHSVRADSKFVEPPYGNSFFSCYTLLLVGLTSLALSLVLLVCFVGVRMNIIQ